MIFVCPECDELRGSMKAMHWHLRCDHKMDGDEAFEAAGAAELAPAGGAGCPANWQSDAEYQRKRAKWFAWNRSHNFRDQFHYGSAGYGKGW